MNHRPSFETGNNSFWTIDAVGDLYLDGVKTDKAPEDIYDLILSHLRNGSHPDCVICKRQEAETQALIAYFCDPRTPEQKAQDADAADYQATIASLLP